jgi:hypothetical protein
MPVRLRGAGKESQTFTGPHRLVLMHHRHVEIPRGYGSQALVGGIAGRLGWLLGYGEQKLTLPSRQGFPYDRKPQPVREQALKPFLRMDGSVSGPPLSGISHGEPAGRTPGEQAGDGVGVAAANEKRIDR